VVNARIRFSPAGGLVFRPGWETVVSPVIASGDRDGIPLDE